MTFGDLDFGSRSGVSGIQARVTFDNGYGASVIRGHGTYGESDGLYELAVVKGEQLCYDTPVTSDVEGYCTPEMITALLEQIEALPTP